MTTRSTAQVDKDILRRRMGQVVKPAAGQRNVNGKLGKPAGARTAAQVDKDAHRRAMGIKVPARGRMSDAALGRGNLGADRARSNGALGGIPGTKGQKRDRIGRFA